MKEPSGLGCYMKVNKLEAGETISVSDGKTTLYVSHHEQGGYLNQNRA